MCSDRLHALSIRMHQVYNEVLTSARMYRNVSRYPARCSGRAALLAMAYYSYKLCGVE